MRLIFISLIALTMLLLVGCNQPTNNNAELPTLVAFATETEAPPVTETATVTQTPTPTETNAPMVTEEIPLATEEVALESLSSNQRYVLADFAQAELWRIRHSGIVTAYQCPQTTCEGRNTYRNGSLVRVVNTEDGWHTVLTLDGSLAYIEERFTEFFDTLEIVTAYQAEAPTQTPASTEVINEPASATPNIAPVVTGGSTPIRVTSSVSDNVINIAPQQPTNPPANNNNNGGQTSNPTTTPTPTLTRTPRPTITANPFFTPVAGPNDVPPGSNPNPSPSGPTGPTSGGGGVPPGSQDTPPDNNPPPPPPPPPGS